MKNADAYWKLYWKVYRATDDDDFEHDSVDTVFLGVYWTAGSAVYEVTKVAVDDLHSKRVPNIWDSWGGVPQKTNL